VGNHVAELVKRELPHNPDIDIKEISAGGIELIEEMMGYDKAIVIDAVATRGRVGTIHRLRPEQLKHTVHFTAPHRFNFASAYQLGRHFASRSMPKRVKIYGVEIEPRRDFTRGLSHKVSRAAQRLAEEIIEDLIRINSK